MLLFGLDVIGLTSSRSRRRVVVITGPSGVGKTTMAELLMKCSPESFSRCITHTTRLPRPGERDGVEYHFTQKAVMQRQIDHGEFVEHADVYGNLYGTSRKALVKAAESGSPLLILDVQGAETVRRSGINALFVCLVPPSTEELRLRMLRRNADTPDAIDKRVRAANHELDTIAKQKWDAYIINDDVQRCFRELAAFLRADGVIEK